MNKMRWAAIGSPMLALVRPLALVLPLALAACASGPPASPPIVWIGGAATHLSADKAQCQAEVDQLDVNQSATYSDPRYGVTSAMAAAVGRDNPLTDQKANVRQAAFVACMNDKGWKAQ